MEERSGIRIAEPEEEFVPAYITGMVFISIVVSLGTLYFLFIEFFNLPPPFSF